MIAIQNENLKIKCHNPNVSSGMVFKYREFCKFRDRIEHHEDRFSKFYVLATFGLVDSAEFSCSSSEHPKNPEPKFLGDHFCFRLQWRLMSEWFMTSFTPDLCQYTHLQLKPSLRIERAYQLSFTCNLNDGISSRFLSTQLRQRQFSESLLDIEMPKGCQDKVTDHKLTNKRRGWKTGVS